MTGAGWDPVEAFTGGDRTRSHHLRRNLATIAEHADDPRVRRLVEEVLAGRRTVRELVRDEAFEAVLDSGMAAFAERWQELSVEERAELVREGQQQEAARREAEGLPPLDEPPAQPGDSPLLRAEK